VPKMKLRSRLFLLPCMLTAFLAASFFLPRPVSAQAEISEVSVEYVFGGPVTFHAAYVSQSPLAEGLVFFRIQGENHTVINSASFGDGRLEFTYDQSSYALKPFAPVDYWFQLTNQEGSVYTSSEYSFYYEDNRFEWQTLERQPFTVHWYDGDVAFAQGILDVAHEGLKKAQSLLTLPDPQQIQIYVYASSEDLQATRRLSRRSGVAGHAEVELSVMIVSLPNLPERRLEAERQVPHELMHILLFQAVERGYENIPTWLNEGLASIVELYPNPDYQAYLESAIRAETLLPFASLCSGFPPDVSDFILSYAQSAYFTRYLYRIYGANSMENVLQSYANGLDCERGFQVTYGVSLAAMQQKWLKESFASVSGKEVEASTANAALPWFALLFVIIALPFAAVLPGIVKPKQ
jgi:hypothetical protein